MKIKELTLFTDQISAQKEFFKNILGFELLEEGLNYFAIQAGFTQLRFQKSSVKDKYHYCFLIPANQLDAAIEWLSQRTAIIKIEGERIKQRFETWNAESIYFWDGDGNLAEFIVRYDLKNEREGTFSLNSILSVNEIGSCTNQIAAVNQFLESQLGSFFWKGDLERFGTNGTEEGLFLLVNPEVKKTWFPTELETHIVPFKAKIEVAGKHFDINFEGGELSLENQAK